MKASSLAARALEPIREFTHRERPAADPTPLLVISNASDVAIHKDDTGAGFDLIFRTRQKVVTDQGIVTTLKPIAGVSLSLDTILALFDNLQPIVEEARPKPQVVQEPALPETKPKRPHVVVNPDLIPTGADVILDYADRLRLARIAAQEESGATAGGNYNKAMARWYAASKFKTIPQHIRNDIGVLAHEVEAIREWTTRQPTTIMRSIKPADLVRRWQSRPKALPAEPRYLDPSLVKGHNGTGNGVAHTK